MHIPKSSLSHLRPLRAFFFRELRAALLNRFVHLFSGAALLGGTAPLLLDPARGEAAPYFLLQVTLYLLPLFALLIGAGSAQVDQEERPFLFTQPGGRWASVVGKFLALWLLLGSTALLLVLPAAIDGTAVGPLAFLWLHALGAGAVFVGLGLACGFSTNDRVKAHLSALSLWLVFLAGFDLLALACAHLPQVQQFPTLWTALLMLNPLDALRIGALFSIDRVPFDLTQTSPVVRWWLGNLALWFAILSVAWTAMALTWSRRCVEKLSP